MEEQNRELPNIKQILLRILILATAIVLPGLDWILFSWSHALLPLLVFYILNEQGFYSGNRVIIIGTLVGFIVSLLFSSVSLFVFAFTLIPAGYVLAYSALKQEGPALSITKATVITCLGWAICLSGLITPGEQAPYLRLVDSLHAGIDEVIEYYRVNGNGSAEIDVAMEETLQQMKVAVPIILPSIITSFAMILVFFTSVSGNRIVAKRCKKECWASFRLWQLPDKLIWFTILTGVATFVPVDLVRFIGGNFLLILSLAYCFQGFSIAVFFMNKWKVPIFVRSFIYVMVIFQSFGTIILLVIGVANTWLNFRKLPQTEPEIKE